MIFGSVCSGIEAASVAWEPLGWRAAFFSEIDRFACAVIAHRFPTVPNLGDMTKFQEWPDAEIDVLVGGTPCQSFSVAGLRGGMADPRGNLALVYLALAARYRPRWVVWENVPGVLSSSGGRDFGSFLGGLVELGYGFAYRVLDAQFFGVPQRRRRVFVVGHLGDWRRAAEVLFEPSSLRRHSPPSREAGEGTAGRTRVHAAVGSGRGWWNESDTGATVRPQESPNKADTLIAFGGNNTSGPIELATACNAHSGRQDFESETLITFDTTQITSPLNRNNPKPGDPSHPLAAGAHAPAIAFHNRQDPDVSGEVTHPLGAKDNGLGVLAPTLTSTNDPSRSPQSEEVTRQVAAVHGATAAVRRLTPRECERLQGFPGDWTLIPYRGKPAADGPRYKALGNSFAVPVVAWIGERIAKSEAARQEVAA